MCPSGPCFVCHLFRLHRDCGQAGDDLVAVRVVLHLPEHETVIACPAIISKDKMRRLHQTDARASSIVTTMATYLSRDQCSSCSSHSSRSPTTRPNHALMAIVEAAPRRRSAAIRLA